MPDVTNTSFATSTVDSTAMSTGTVETTETTDTNGRTSNEFYLSLFVGTSKLFL